MRSAASRTARSASAHRFRPQPTRTLRSSVPADSVQTSSGGLTLVRYRPLFSGPAVERVRELDFQRPRPEAELSEEDARKTRDPERRRDHRPLERDVRHSCARASASELRPGVVRVPEDFAGELQPQRGGLQVTEPWWVSLIKAAVIVNLIMVAFAYTTWLERKLLGRMQNRYGPNRAGPFGLLQPFADLVKLVRKESFFPVAAQTSAVHRRADHLDVHRARRVRGHPVRGRLADLALPRQR